MTMGGADPEPTAATSVFDRAVRPPRPLDVELPRLRLLSRLDERWEHTVTVVCAGPGFGKTTMLAQAVRSNLLEPRGVDVWISCDASHQDAGRFAGAILHAIAPRSPDNTAVPVPVTPGVAEITDALIRIAPLEVCVLLDDVHELPVDSPGAELLRRLVRTLPATAHLVLSGRTAPDVPLARLEAAGEVLRLEEPELVFTDIEVTSLARRLGSHPRLARSLHGWPALVRLAFAAGPNAPAQFAREEILARLPDATRRTLAALAALGIATEKEVAAVAGTAVDLIDLAHRIPLVGVLDDGRFRAHDLWSGTVSRMLSPLERSGIRRRSADILAARGDLARAGTLACEAGDWALLGELAVRLVHSTLSALPVTIAQHWLESVPAAVADEAGFLLLRAAVNHAADYTDPGVDRLLDRAWLGMRAAADHFGAVAVVGHALIAAHSRADIDRLIEIQCWAEVLPAESGPVVGVMRHSIAGVIAELDGDPEGALVHFDRAPMTGVPRALQLSTRRFQFHCLNMAGRGSEAAELADRTLGDAWDPHIRLSGAMARWFSGDPTELGRLRAAAPTSIHRPASATESAAPATARDTFVATALAAVVGASCGEAAAMSALPCGDLARHGNPRDAVLACVAQAAVAVARGDEDTAARVYRDLLTARPLEDRLAERHLRRFLALGYVLHEGLRRHWDTADLGPSHLDARAAARALLGLRRGEDAGAITITPEHALCFLPLPWSVELAARLAVTGHPHGTLLIRALFAGIGQPVRRQLEILCRDDDPAAARGAEQLTARLPVPPAHRIGIEVIGHLRLLRDGAVVDAPELRRGRVRQLLGALVLHDQLSRDRVIELLWPDLDRADAGRNLRVTLTHLRRLLEPGRCGGSVGHHLRTTDAHIALVRSEALTVDLWTVRDLAAQARCARASGDIDAAAELLCQAVDHWRSEPLPDLAPLSDPDIAARIGALRAAHIAAMLELGELRLVSGDPAPAFLLAERALMLEPFDGRGHRLLLAAALRSHHPVEAARARRTVCAALRELGVAPDPATALLLRQLAPKQRPDQQVRALHGR